jgi:hypothetical protein
VIGMLLLDSTETHRRASRHARQLFEDGGVLGEGENVSAHPSVSFVGVSVLLFFHQLRRAGVGRNGSTSAYSALQNETNYRHLTRGSL